ncbi:NADP-dependent oxidoreductase [Nonomuraea sp. NPDC050328]|uniref:NADP-dependent oxidoreductase n=1 Tax=Nonomuraea sp. NPDC050328 TaxID=3364361 RepID=UPI0037B6C427
MRAAAFEIPGSPEVLKVMEVPTPQAGPGQVRVRVKAAGVQPYDAAVRAGWVPAGVTDVLPRIPGNEFAGVVDQSDSLPVGTEVLGFTQLGAYAEYVVVPADQVTPKPAGLAWETAGGLTAGVQTAEIAIDNLAVGPQDTLLIHGASGSVGTAAVQIARMRGARVIGTGRPENHEHLRALGAIPVAYGEGLRERLAGLGPVTVVLDAAGGEALDLSLELVGERKRILTLVEHGRAAELGVRVTEGVRTAERLGRYAALVAEGRFAFPVRRAYPLERAADAHREIETGHGRGKVVVVVA